MSRANVRWFFVAVMIFLPLQYSLVGLAGVWEGEPWPALVLPAFQAPTVDGEGAVTDMRSSFVATFGDGQRVAVPTEVVLKNIPPSHRTSVLSEQCQPASLSGAADTERCRQPAVRRWLRAHLSQAYPDRTPQRLDVVWTELRYTLGSGALKATPRDTLTLTFDAS